MLISLPIEIEHKFLVHKDLLPTTLTRNCVDISQGYLTEKGNTVRVRISRDLKSAIRAHLCIKGKSKGLAKPEFEYEIPVHHAEHMLRNMCEDRIVHKNRYLVTLPNFEDTLMWEVDVFKGHLDGLIVAEVEVPTVDYELAIPPWVRKNVSKDRQYKNKQLAISQTIPPTYFRKGG